MPSEISAQKPKKVLSLFKLREEIRKINRMKLDRSDFRLIKESIYNIINSVKFVQFSVSHAKILCRSRKSSEKLVCISEIHAPAPDLVRNFQRCNRPKSPMFYCAWDPGTCVYEINPIKDDKIYLSTWQVEQKFWCIHVFPEVKTVLRPRDDIVHTFVETKFTQRIHDTFSNDYKISAAFSEVLTQAALSGGLKDDSSYNDQLGITYPSVAHPGKSECLALPVQLAEKCVRLKYVQELLITNVESEKIDYNRTDFGKVKACGRIDWTGRDIRWTLEPPHGRIITAKMESHGWVLYDQNGNVVDPD